MTDDLPPPIPTDSPSAPPPLPEARRLGDDAVVRLLIPVGRSGWAVAAGYFGLLAPVMLPAPLAIVFGALGIWDIRRSGRAGRRKYGMGRAVFGLVMGVVFSLILVWVMVNARGER